jgi:hypothetical protein
MMRVIMRILYSMKEYQRRDVFLVIHCDDSDDEVKVESTRDELEGEVAIEEIMIRTIKYLGGKSRLETPLYYKNLNFKELIYWIGEMKKLFELKQVKYHMKVRFACTKLNIHASLWWDKLWLDRLSGGKEKIKTWDRVEAKLKSTIFPMGYTLNLLIRLKT